MAADQSVRCTVHPPLYYLPIERLKLIRPINNNVLRCSDRSAYSQIIFARTLGLLIVSLLTWSHQSIQPCVVDHKSTEHLSQ